MEDEKNKGVKINSRRCSCSVFLVITKIYCIGDMAYLVAK